MHRRPKYLIANADEMEPGTFKDRLLLEGNPHQLIEGMILAAYAIQADISYIFLRWAYKKAAQLLRKSIHGSICGRFAGKEYSGQRVQSRNAFAYRRWPLYVRRRNGLVKCAGRKARHTAGKTAISANKRFVWKAHHCNIM